jgi:hypothetical protein
MGTGEPDVTLPVHVSDDEPGEGGPINIDDLYAAGLVERHEGGSEETECGLREGNEEDGN